MSMLRISKWITTHQTALWYAAIAVFGMLGLSIVGTYWTTFFMSVRFVVASFFIFFAPGWCITLLFFPFYEPVWKNNQKENFHSLDWIERTTLASILSLIVSSAIVF